MKKVLSVLIMLFSILLLGIRYTTFTTIFDKDISKSNKKQRRIVRKDVIWNK